MPINENLNSDSTFYKKVEDDNNICKNCYRRLTHESFPYHTMPDCVTVKREYTDNADFNYFGDEDNSGRPSILRSYCKCGFVDDGKIRPLNKSKLLEVAGRVFDRLEEENVEVDESVYFSTVREKKENPDNQFNEEVIIERAIEKALIENE